MRSLALLPLLLATAAVAAETPPQQKAPANAADPNKLVCKRETEIGSLVASKKVCLTKAEWAARRADSQSEARRMQESVGGPQ